MTKHWTPEEDEVLIREYPDANMDDLLKLFPGHGVSSLHNRAHLLRLKKSVTWREKQKAPPRPKKNGVKQSPKDRPVPFGPFKAFERQILLDLGPTCTIVELKMLLSRRRTSDILRMADSLGVKILDRETVR